MKVLRQPHNGTTFRKTHNIQKMTKSSNKKIVARKLTDAPAYLKGGGWGGLCGAGDIKHCCRIVCKFQFCGGFEVSCWLLFSCGREVSWFQRRQGLVWNSKPSYSSKIQVNRCPNFHLQNTIFPDMLDDQIWEGIYYFSHFFMQLYVNIECN